MSRCFALIPAAGQGTRMQDALPKQYLRVLGDTILYSSIAALLAEPRILRAFVVLAPDDRHFDRHDWSIFGARLQPIYAGGASRAETVGNGLKAIEAQCNDNDWILVHDAARPCLPKSALSRLIDETIEEPVGAILAVGVVDSLKTVEKGQVTASPSRNGLWQAQTPQMFRYGLLRSALTEKTGITDESSAIEALGLSPKVVVGDRRNIKVTYPEDLKLAEAIFKMSPQ